LQLLPDGVKVRGFRQLISEPWTNVTSIDVAEPDEVESLLSDPRYANAGPLTQEWGKLNNQTFVVVQGTFGEFIFHVKKGSINEVRDKLESWNDIWTEDELEEEDEEEDEDSTTAASSHEIDRVPRSVAEESLLLRVRPPGWEYLLFGSVLLRKRNELEAQWEEQISYARRADGAEVSESHAVEHLSRALQKNAQIIEVVERHMSARSQKRAFGKPGKDGDPERIARLAEGILLGNWSLLEWAADIRAATVPQEYRRLYLIASEMADAPLKQFREFFDRTIEELDGLPLAVRQQRPLTLDLVLELKLDDEIMQGYHRELSRLQQAPDRVRRPIPESVRHEVWRRDHGQCVDCGSRERLEFDHIIPVSKGGSNTARNIELLCEPCNRAKAAKV
jgi:hypothetical protein